eukprot:XP_001695334.1 predicted protein [Chlamydomonas reinhardtii]
MGVMRPREPAGLVRWRDASQGLVGASRASADLFTEYLISGGPDAIKSLQATIRRLQLQLEEQKADGRLERYRKLQKDLEECDKVRAALRDALVSSQWSDDEVDAYLSKKLFKASQLYGASRPQALGLGVKYDAGPHMESVSRLLTAAELLEAAEQAYRLPSVAHAEVQADDGSRKYIQTLEQQMATLAGQKMQLMNQVASLTEQNRVLDMKLEGALDQVSELRRQKTEMLAHADNLWVTLACVAGWGWAWWCGQAALQEKTEQVDTLRGLYLELRETLEKLAGDVASGQQDMARRLLDATNAAAADQRTLLLDVRDAADGGQRAAAHSAVAVEDMSGVQRVLVGEMAQQREVTQGAYERQLAALMALLQQSEADRVRLARQAIAASALNRVEDKRHQKTVALLLHEVPGSVAERLAPELGALAEGTAAVADGLAKTQDTLAAAGIVVPGLVGPARGLRAVRADAAATAAACPGDLAVAWYPPGLVPSDSGGRGGGPPGYPAAPSYLSGRRALGMTSPNQWDDVPYIDQFQYNYQPLQQAAPSARASGSGAAAGPPQADTTHASATAAPIGAGAAVPPLVEPIATVSRMQISGTLTRYGPAGPQVALLAGAPGVARAVVLVGGLTDGLLFAPYVATLTDALARRGWAAVHASLQSAWTGYGTGSLDRDAADLRLLCAHLRQQHGIRGVVLVGHSTGCQDAVSDVEWLSSYPELEPVAARAAELLAAGRGEEVCCRLGVADNAPISAARFLSLYRAGGDDDMFSEGLPQQELQRIFAPVGSRPCLLLVSGADECVPRQDQIAPRAAALQAVIGPRAVLRVVDGAPHNLAGCETQALETVCAFLEAL